MAVWGLSAAANRADGEFIFLGLAVLPMPVVELRLPPTEVMADSREVFLNICSRSLLLRLDLAPEVCESFGEMGPFLSTLVIIPPPVARLRGLRFLGRMPVLVVFMEFSALGCLLFAKLGEPMAVCLLLSCWLSIFY